MDEKLADTEEAGFEDGAQVPMTPTETPEPAPETAAVIEPPVEYAQITKADYDSLMAKANSVDKAFGKIGDIQRVLTQLQSATPAGQTVQVTAEDFAELRSEYPELAELHIQGLNKVLGKLKGSAPAEPVDVEKIVGERINGIVPKLKIDMTLDAIVDGDWVAERNSTAFKTWEAAQPKNVQDLALSDDLADAKKMMRLYMTAKNTPAPKPAPVQKTSSRTQQLAAAFNPKGSGGHTTAGPTTEEEAFNSA